MAEEVAEQRHAGGRQETAERRDALQPVWVQAGAGGSHGPGDAGITAGTTLHAAALGGQAPGEQEGVEAAHDAQVVHAAGGGGGVARGKTALVQGTRRAGDQPAARWSGGYDGRVSARAGGDGGGHVRSGDGGVRLWREGHTEGGSGGGLRPPPS